MKKLTYALAFLAAGGASPNVGRAEALRLSFSQTCPPTETLAEARCGVLTVPENRERPSGRSIPLRFVVVPGKSPRETDPIFYIAGGPGESAVHSLRQVLPTLRSVDAARDIVFVDQRGTGASNPLTCPGGFDLVSARRDDAALRRCIALLQQHADLGRYSSFHAAADLNAVRRALGYSRVNLIAVSYGVRVALLYMRDHPREVRSVVLRAAYPLDFNIIDDGIAAADSELAKVIDECGAKPSCRDAFPRLAEQLREVDARLAVQPVQVKVTDAAGRAAEVPVTRELFHEMLLTTLLAAESRQYVPLIIGTAATRGFQPLGIVVQQLRAGFAEMPVGMYLTILCGEDAPRSQRQAKAARTPLWGSATTLLSICSRWPAPPVKAERLRPFSSPVPTLIVSGTLDPVTPVATAERLSASLGNARPVVLPATAHGPMFPDCVRQDVTRFIASASLPADRDPCSKLALPSFTVAAPTHTAGPQSVRSPNVEGTWDLVWQTRKGPSKNGYLVIDRKGTTLVASVHGQGSLRASGTVEGNRLRLQGSRLFVPFTIEGAVDGDKMEGVLKVMSIERRFVGMRRGGQKRNPPLPGGQTTVKRYAPRATIPSYASKAVPLA